MRPFFVFLLGVFFGFLAKWLYDFVYWRERYNHRLAEAATPIPVPAVKVAPAPVLPAPVARPKRAAKAPVAADDLKTIKGIGPAIERKLNAAGIRTFAQLGALKTDDLRAILGKSIERLADEADLLKQARRLARKK
jgi:predicted flap endonuclease-1-like 5' DNA nuclease